MTVVQAQASSVTLSVRDLEREIEVNLAEIQADTLRRNRGNFVKVVQSFQGLVSAAHETQAQAMQTIELQGKQIIDLHSQNTQAEQTFTAKMQALSDMVDGLTKDFEALKKESGLQRELAHRKEQVAQDLLKSKMDATNATAQAAQRDLQNWKLEAASQQQQRVQQEQLLAQTLRAQLEENKKFGEEIQGEVKAARDEVARLRQIVDPSAQRLVSIPVRVRMRLRPH